MLKNLLANGFVQIYRALFIAGFAAVVLVGVGFLGAVIYNLVF